MAIQVAVPQRSAIPGRLDGLGWSPLTSPQTPGVTSSGIGLVFGIAAAKDDGSHG